MEGTSGAPRKGASRDIHFATICENLRKMLKNRRFSWNSAFDPGTKFPENLALENLALENLALENKKMDKRSQ